jgi:hypothetical protein
VVAGGAGGARPPGADTDEERTSIDPPAPGVSWEDGSTTVEEPTGAEPGRRSATTTGTGDVPTNTGTGEEPTVEDPARGSHPLMLVPTAPPAAKPAKPRAAPAAARLVAVSGNDTGRHFSLETSRVMSIGRAVDNEVVLTDIAVSRRHLELVHDGQAWTLRDRGSGNGTVVNDRIEDGAYQLRHGDRIEIGNTVLRFELPTPPAPGQGWGARDDEEASTVAGRQPPRPPAGFEPAVTAPMPKVPAARGAQPARRGAPTTAPQRPSQLPADRARSEPALPRGDQSGSHRHGPLTAPPPGVADSGPLLQGLVPPAGPAAMHAASAETGPGRHFTTTALVEPFPRAPTILPYSFGIGPISRKKLLIGSLLGAAAIGLIGVVAAMTTSETPVGASVAAASTALPASTWGTDEAALRATRPSGGRVMEVDDLDRIEIGDDEELDALSGADLAPPAPAAAKPREPAAPEPAPEPEPEPAPAIDEETAAEKAAAEKAAAALAEADRLAEKAAAEKAAADRAAAEKAALAFVPPVILPPKLDKPPAKVAPTNARPAPKPAAAKPAPRPAPVRTAPAPKPRKTIVAAAERDEEPRTPKGAAAARRKGQTQYAAKDFRGAAQTLRIAASEADDDEAAELRDLAADYEAVGSGLNAGNAALTSNPADATTAFQKAYQADRRLGAVHTDYLRAKLAQSSPKAAASFMARGNFEAAKRAVDTAVSVGAGASPTVQQVRQSLERKAGELYASGMKMLSSEPEDARALLRRVLKIVDASSPWYGKAYKVVGK